MYVDVELEDPDVVVGGGGKRLNTHLPERQAANPENDPFYNR